MKPFLKTTLASMLGIVLASIILTIFSVFVMSGLLQSSDSTSSLQAESILKISLDGSVCEYSGNNPLADIALLNPNPNTTTIGLDEIRSAIAKAKENPNIKGIYLENGMVSCGAATAEEIREALNDFKESGKFIYAYADYFTQTNYYISSVADSIFLNPIGIVDFHGMAVRYVYYTDVIKKLGIQAEIFKVGTFKAAVEPFTNTEMSPANRQQTEAYLQSIWNHQLKNISLSRSISIKELNQIANTLTNVVATENALKNHMVDALLCQAEVMDLLAQKTTERNRDAKELVSVKKMNKIPTPNKKYIAEKIAVLYAEGEIYDKSDVRLGIYHESLIEEIEKIRQNSNIKAVVFRINSPGGSAFASEQIYKAIERLKEKKPVVVSMGDYAASGGYYISAPADKIITSPTTLTGSIGVFSIAFNIEKTAKKAGFHFDTAKTNDLSDFGNNLREMTAAEKVIMQKNVERIYDIFVEHCSEGRNIEDAQIRRIAEGRVWSGEQAVRIGLADNLGSINDAISAAAELAELHEYDVLSFPKKKDILSLFMENFNENVKLRLINSYLDDYAKTLMEIESLSKQKGVLARMPYMISF